MSNAEAGDASFGRAAQEKEEKADRLVSQGADPTDAAEGSGVDPRPRAGGKASEGAPPAADQEGDAPNDEEMPTIMQVAASEEGIATQTPTPM